MLSLKHKFSPTLLFSGLFLAIILVQVCLVPKAHAATLTCPDGYKVENIPNGLASAEKNDICANHQTGDSGGDPTCYDTQVKQKVACDTSDGAKLENDKCYTQNRGGPNGAVTGHTEIDCKTATDTINNADAQKTNTYSSEKLVCASNDDGYCNFVKDYVNPGIQFLAVTVGIIVTIMIIIGGIQYSAAGGDPNAVAKAKKRIFNAIGALVAFGLLYALLQYVIPGGLL